MTQNIFAVTPDDGRLYVKSRKGTQVDVGLQPASAQQQHRRSARLAARHGSEDMQAPHMLQQEQLHQQQQIQSLPQQGQEQADFRAAGAGVEVQDGVQLLSSCQGPAGATAAVPPQHSNSLAADAMLQHTPRRQRRRWAARGQSALRVAWEERRLGYDEIPEWMRDNSLILRQYRPQLTLRQAIGSLFSLHNETYNVWSHIVGILVILVVLLDWWREPLPSTSNPSTPPKWPLVICLLSNLYVYGASASAHLFFVVSKRANDILWRLDHAAIAVSCTCAFFPICHYAFACHGHTAAFYISVTVALAMAVTGVSIVPRFHAEKYRPFRAAVQLSFPLWAQLPLLHATRLLLPHEGAMAGLKLVYTSIGVMVLGAVIFAVRLTESILPGRVDLIGSSHNIMHTLVVVSHVLFAEGGRALWRWRASTEGMC